MSTPVYQIGKTLNIGIKNRDRKGATWIGDIVELTEHETGKTFKRLELNSGVKMDYLKYCRFNDYLNGG